MTRSKHLDAGNRCRRQVWMLAVTGLLFGAVLLGSIKRSVTSMKSVRQERHAATSMTTDVITSIERCVSSSLATSSALLDGTPTAISRQDGAQLQTLADKIKHQLSSTQTESQNLIDHLNEFRVYLDRCEAFSGNFKTAATARDSAKEQSREALRQLAAAFESRAGIQMLQLAREVRQFRESSGAASSKAVADKLVSEWIPRLSQGTADKELSDLALFCEQLFGETQIDDLADIKDNLFLPSINRIHRSIASRTGARAKEIESLLTDFEKALFGNDFTRDEHAQLNVGSDGLYFFCDRWLTLQSERAALKLEGQTRFERLRVAQTDLERSVHDQMESMADLTEKTIESVWRSMSVLGVLCGTIFVVLARRIARTVSNQVDAIDEQSNVLAKEVNDRIQSEKERERLHAELETAARQAGMAEVATGVLHNVGNVLNSVNVSAGVLRDLTKTQAIDTLSQASEVLNQHVGQVGDFIANDPRGKHLPNLLTTISKSLTETRTKQRSELDSLVSNIDHIKSVVAMQQTYAVAGGAKEITTPSDLMDDALKLNEASIERHSISIKKDYKPVGEILVEKHRIIQILVNLIKNSRESLKLTRGVPRQITLSIYEHEEFVCMQVTDTGVGISDDVMKRIFQHGFTTKSNGHGFGLHSCANAAQESGGSLSAESAGEGQGATFLLRLPLSNRNEQTENGQADRYLRAPEPAIS